MDLEETRNVLMRQLRAVEERLYEEYYTHDLWLLRELLVYKIEQLDRGYIVFP